MLCLTKSGQPVLYFPSQPSAARETLRLYPAQSWKARIVRLLLDIAFSANVPLLFNDSFPPEVNFNLIEWFGMRPLKADLISLKNVGVFAGNPKVPGRRYIFLLCSHSGEGLYLAKIGFTNDAVRKVLGEKEFLLANAGRPGIPHMLGVINDHVASGIILPFIRGTSPRLRGIETEIGAILGTWISDTEMPLGEITPWKEISCHFSSMSSKIVRPVLGHGDFAPWNIIVDVNGRWHVIDWERGTDHWVPGWDWFHYLVQPLILVKKASAISIRKAFSCLCRNESFLQYTRKAGIESLSADLFRAYLVYAHKVLKQTEGQKALKELAYWALNP